MSEDTPNDAVLIAAIKEKRDRAALELEDLPNKRKALEKREVELRRILSDAASAARLFGLDLETPEDVISVTEASVPRRPADSQMPTIREVALEWLKMGGNQGVKASTIRNHVVRTYHTELHEKTVGMTLWRLSKDGLARREGHTWFFVPPQAETKNPGEEAPGSVDAHNRKEDA